MKWYHIHTESLYHRLVIISVTWSSAMHIKTYRMDFVFNIIPFSISKEKRTFALKETVFCDIWEGFFTKLPSDIFLISWYICWGKRCVSTHVRRGLECQNERSRGKNWWMEFFNTSPPMKEINIFCVMSPELIPIIHSICYN